MKKTRRVLAIALVTAALCADRAAIAAPTAVSVPMARMAVKLANRMSVHLRHSTAAIIIQTPRFADQSFARRLPSEQPVAELPRLTLSPFQFRLPPPVL
jgi:hypothetical protein